MYSYALDSANVQMTMTYKLKLNKRNPSIVFDSYAQIVRTSVDHSVWKWYTTLINTQSFMKDEHF